MADKQHRRHDLELGVRVDEQHGFKTPQLVPRVDGSVLFLDLDTRAELPTSGLGMDPDQLLGRGSPLLPREPGSMSDDVDEPPARAVVWRCNCGEVGCASIGLRVYREKDSFTGWDVVVWDDWRIRFGGREGLADPGPLRFDTATYYREVTRAAGDRWWESVPHRVGRQLTASLDARPELLAQWGTALLFAGGYLHTERGGGVRLWLRHARGRYELQLPCSTTADPAAETRRIVDRLERVDPGTWTECRPIAGL